MKMKINIAPAQCILYSIYFVYNNWSLIKNNVSCIKFNTHKETKIW